MSGYYADNYACPCCSFPYLSPGRRYSEPFGRTHRIEQVVVCRQCGSEFTVSWNVKKNQYLPPVYMVHKNNFALQQTQTSKTICASCQTYKETPLRIDFMGGYVCLSCVDKQLANTQQIKAEIADIAEQLGSIEGLGMYREVSHIYKRLLKLSKR